MNDYPIVMAIHAAISRRSWNEVEQAANKLRDYEQPKWKHAADRIEALEAALRQINALDQDIVPASDRLAIARSIAQAALLTEQKK